jgi:hypothetical protein
MTLTTSRPKTNEDFQNDFKNLNPHFQTLRKRIERKFMSKVEYFKVKTNEGNGVLHVVYIGCRIPQRWLSKAWEEIHNAPIVDIREVRCRTKQIARYVASQYVAKQEQGFNTYQRMSWSWNWVFRGFVAIWEQLKADHGLRKALAYWDFILRSGKTYLQQKDVRLDLWMVGGAVR